jgi:DNA-binding HxlR family transcriptional regulator
VDEYGQFCPIAKATELVGEKWSILIIRELLMGSTRFNQIQRGLTNVSPTLLTKRLDSLQKYGLLVKKKISGQKGYEYFPTQACEDLLPIIISLGNWGVTWAKSNLKEKDYDVELLMLYLERSVQTDKLPGNQTVVRFKFDDFEKYSDWWMVIEGDEIDLCVNDPGKDIDVYFTCSVKTLTNIWMGYSTYRKAAKDNLITIVGDDYLTRDISVWLKNCELFDDLPSASEI